MKKKYTAAVLIAAMFAVTQKLPMRFERAHAEGEDGSVGEPGTPDQQNDQGVEAVVSSEPVYIEESQAEAVAKVETVGEPEATEEPEVVGEPEATEEPEVVEEPEATEEPEVVEEPEATEEPEVVEEPEATEEPEVVEEPEATEEPEVVEEPEATETPVPTETPIPTETPAPTETPIPVEEQQRELPAILMQIEDEGFAYVKTAGDGVKLYADAWMERRIGTLDGGQSVLLALDYEKIEENRFAVYVVFAHDGDVMEGYVRLSGLDPQTMDGEAFIREHENSAVKCDDYPLVNVAFTPKQAEKEKEETTGAEKKADASIKGGAEETAVPEATVTPEITAAPEATVTPEPTATPECTPEPTEEPLNLPPIPDQIERNGYAYVRTAELEVKLYTDENLDEQFASIYEKGAVLLADGYAERASAKNYALHVYAFDGEDVVEGFVSLKRMIQSPLDSDLESGAADVDGLPVAETSIHWKKNAAPTPTQTPTPTLTPEPTQTPIATLEAKTAQNGKEAEQLADGQPEATDGEADRDDEAELPIIKNPEQPVVVNPGKLPTEEQPEATDGEAEPEQKPDEQPTQLQVNVLIDASNGLAYEGGEIGFIAAVSGAEPDELLFQWQYSEDGENWEDIAGATGQTHEETVTPMNANGYWRVLVKKQAETQKGE